MYVGLTIKQLGEKDDSFSFLVHIWALCNKASISHKKGKMHAPLSMALFRHITDMLLTC